MKIKGIVNPVSYAVQQFILIKVAKAAN